MRLLGIGLLIVALAAFAIPFTQPLLQMREPPERPSGRRPGETHADFGIPLGYSIQGLSVAREVRAELQVFGEDADPETASPIRTYADLPFRVTSNSPWESTVQVADKEIMRPMYLTLRIESLPDDPDLYGKRAKIVATGEVTYPNAVQTITEPSGKRVTEFDERTTPIKNDVTFSFMSRAAHEQFQREWQDYEATRPSQEQGLLGGLRGLMTYSLHPGLLKAVCWVLAAACGVAGGWITLVRRRTETAKQSIA